MLLDRLENAQVYTSLQRGFAAGFDFLRRADLAELPDGQYDTGTEEVFVLLSRSEGRGREKSLLESHRRYVDIQFVIDGADCIGWMPTAECRRIATPYDAERDVEFYYDRPATWLSVPSGTFAVFFPQDAHAPRATEGPLHKAVVKVALPA